jgi:hypothetical protein
MFILELLFFLFVFLPVIPAGYHWEKKTSAQVFMLGKTCVALWVFIFTEEPSIASYVFRLMRRFTFVLVRRFVHLCAFDS